jgi:hypothetical protein
MRADAPGSGTAAKRAGLPKLPKGEAPTPEALQAAAANIVFVVITLDRQTRRSGRAARGVSRA